MRELSNEELAGVEALLVKSGKTNITKEDLQKGWKLLNYCMDTYGDMEGAVLFSKVIWGLQEYDYPKLVGLADKLMSFREILRGEN